MIFPGLTRCAVCKGHPHRIIPTPGRLRLTHRCVDGLDMTVTGATERVVAWWNDRCGEGQEKPCMEPETPVRGNEDARRL